MYYQKYAKDVYIDNSQQIFSTLIFYLGLSEVYRSHYPIKTESAKPEPMIFPTQLVPLPKNPFSDGDTSVLPGSSVKYTELILQDASQFASPFHPPFHSRELHFCPASWTHMFCMFSMSCKFLPLGFSCSEESSLLLPTPHNLNQAPGQ